MAEFMTVARLDEVPPGEMKAVKVNGHEVCLANVDGEIYAIGNVCTHAGAPLCDGYLDGETLECPWHAGWINVKTGEALQMPVLEPSQTFKVEVQGEEIRLATD